jgi:zinc/manganese transport system substrate-binding protein
MVSAIKSALVATDPAGAATYDANARAYLARLDQLDAEVKAAINTIPPDRRRIITSHDAFGYFGTAYGIAFIAPQGVSTEAEANAKAVARIIRQIRAEKIPAVFLENISDPRLIDRIAAETGAKIGGTLFSDALSAADGPAGTYINMMRHNLRELVSALGR